MFRYSFSRTPSILVVDDEPDNFDVVEGFLFNEGYHLSYVSSAGSAFNVLTKQLPDLILLDAMMPDIDGFDFCERCKQNPEWKHIPIIMVTALGSEHLADCLAKGADDFIAKPINKLELKARVISMLRIKFQYDALKMSLSLRDDLTNMVIHDFTNPLASILLQTEFLQHIELPERAMMGLHRIRHSAVRLQGLTNDLLTYAKAEAGVLSLQTTDFDLWQLLQDVVNDFEELAAVRSVRILTCAAGNLPHRFLGDRPLLLRVFNNLLANALKFSPYHAQIQLAIEWIAGNGGEPWLQVKVIDQGNGVSDALKTSIFQKYEIGEQRQNVAQTGLGLAFCKLVIESHGGKIYVQDNEPKGAVFVVELPATAAQPEHLE